MIKILSKNEEETKQFAKLLAVHIVKGMLITLEGDLGAGKTTFVKGFAEGLDIKRAVTSPTFTIMKQYDGRLPLYHMDVYRLESAEEESGLDDYIYGDGVAVIEWAQFIEDDLPKDRLAIEIKYKDNDVRELFIEPIGSQYKDLLKKVLENGDIYHDYINH